MMNQKEKDFYIKLFSLSASPTIKELKKKYRELIKIYHPDMHPENIEGATRIVQQLNDAYEILLTNLHRIFSEKPLSSSPDKTNLHWNIDVIISSGDDAIRDAVITGWLKRTPKDGFAKSIRNTVKNAYTMLHQSDIAYTGRIVFYLDLFSTFLKATALKKPRPLPDVYNATRFFHHYASANNYLDSGIRNYYRFTENKRKLTLGNIPLSFLKDAVRLYSMLKHKIGDTILKDTIQAKIELAELFRIRIQDQVL